MAKDAQKKKSKQKSKRTTLKINQLKNTSRVEEQVRQLRPIDDIMFHKLMEDDEVCQEVLQVVMEDPNLKVLDVRPQEDIKSLQGRSVRLDVFCTLGDGRFCNIEVQRSNNDNHFKRVRYNEACITANSTNTGEDFKDVPDVVMIYIAEFDPFHAKRTIYHCYTVCEETGQKVNNGLLEIYLTTTGQDEKTLIKELMNCFLQTEVNHPSFPKLSNRMKVLKKSEGGLNEMCKVMEEFAKEIKSEAVLDVQKETIATLIRNGLDFKGLTTLLTNYPQDLIAEVYEEMRVSDD